MLRTALLTAVAVAGAIALWSLTPDVHGTGPVLTISSADTHALAHLEGLPVAEIEDYSLIYPAIAKK